MSINISTIALARMMRALVYLAGLISLGLFVMGQFAAPIGAVMGTGLSVDVLSASPQAIDLQSVALDVPAWLSLVFVALSIVPLLAFLICLYHFDRLAVSYQAGEFFSRTTNRRFSWISLLLIVIALTSSLDQLFAQSFMGDAIYQVTPPMLGAGWVLVSIDLPIVILGIMFYFMSKVMDEAIRMKFDLELTV